MNGIIKIRTLSVEGKREKLALTVSTGERIPLTARTVGFDTGCLLIVEEKALRIVAGVAGTPDFRYNGATGRDFEVQAAGVWEGEAGILEFLELPKIESTPEDTRYLSMQDLQGPTVDLHDLKASPPATEQEPEVTSSGITVGVDAGSPPSADLDPVTPPRADSANDPGNGAGHVTDAEEAFVEIEQIPEEDPDDRATAVRTLFLQLLLLAIVTEPAVIAAKILANGKLRLPWLSGTAIVVALTLLARWGFQRFLANHRWNTLPSLDLTKRLAWSTAGGFAALLLIGSGAVRIHSLTGPSEAELQAQTQAPAQAETPAQAQPQTPAQAEVAAHAQPEAQAQTQPQAQAQAETPAQAQAEPAPAPPAENTESAPPPVAIPQEQPAPQPIPVVEKRKAAPAPARRAAFSEADLFAAIRAKDLRKVQKIVQSRAVNPNHAREQGFSPLHRAAIRGDLALVQYLISRRVDLDPRDPNGNTPLMWATFKKQKAVVTALVKRGANLTIRRRDGMRAVDIAKRFGLKSHVAMLTPKSKPAPKSKKQPVTKNRKRR